MRDIFITSSILILAIFLIRILVKGKINPCIQYALWLLVVIRLVLPIPLWNSRLSILNFFPAVLSNESAGYNINTNMAAAEGYNQPSLAGESGVYNQPSMVNGSDAYDQPSMANGSGAHNKPSMANGSDTHDQLSMAGESNAYNNPDIADALNKTYAYIRNLLPFVWAAGLLFIGGYMLFYQRKWKRYLNENRKPLYGMEKYKGGLSVYTVEGLPSPCLSGRSIYLTDKMAENKEELEHILVHEYCHYKQLDSIWVIVRCILTAIYWFNPLVWAAAYISKQDSELACDEAAIRMLGEEERIAYGKTLLRLVSGDACDRYRIGIASTMNGGEKGIKERICMIAKKPKYFAAAAAVVLVIAAALIAVTFSGAGHKGESLTASEDNKEVPELESIKEDIAAQYETMNYEAINKEELELKSQYEAANEKELELKSMKEEIAAQYEAIKAAEMQKKSMKEEIAAQYEAIKAAEMQKEEAFMRELDRYDEQVISAVLQGKEADIKDPKGYMQCYVNQGEEGLDEGLYKLAELEGENNSGIRIYGVYTKEYFCKGVKILIGEDVNNYNIRWLPSTFLNMEGNISVYEKAEDGMPRVFAWKVPIVNDIESEIWKLYIFDRYDTGTLDMYQFSSVDYYDQLEERITFGIVQSERKIYVYDNGELAGTMDIPTDTDSAMKKVESAMLDLNRINWELGESEEELKLIAAVGLKYEGMDTLVHPGLNPIAISVECGDFGERSFTIGKASVRTDLNIYDNTMSETDELLCDGAGMDHHDVKLAYTNPCPEFTRVSDNFGVRVHPVTGEERMHNGIDLTAERGADIVAAAEGTVYRTGYDADHGNYIVLYHVLNGEFTYYEHCDEVLVKQWEKVTQGQKIATVGSSGRSTGAHLHFARSRNGEYVEPEIMMVCE